MKQVTNLYDNEFCKELDEWKTLSKNYNDSVPFLVNDCIAKLSTPLQDLLEEKDDFYESYRRHLNTRGLNFERAINELFSKYTWVYVCNQKINKEKKPFVLYLQDFEEKTYRFEHGVMRMAENFSGKGDICDLAEKYPDIIFVYVGVPMDDPGVDYACLNMVHGEHKNVLRIDCGKNWLETVKRYIEEASCVVVHVKDLGSGTKKEIDYIKKKQLLGKTCFITEVKKLITDYLERDVIFSGGNYEKVEKMYCKNINCRTKVGLPVSSLWIDGTLRIEQEKELELIDKQLIDNYKKNLKESAAAQLDKYFLLLGLAIELEDFSRIISYLFPIINLLSVYSPKLLKNRNKQVCSYLSYFISLGMTLESMYKYTATIEDNETFVNIYNTTSFIKNAVVWIRKIIISFELRKNICVRKGYNKLHK